MTGASRAGWTLSGRCGLRASAILQLFAGKFRRCWSGGMPSLAWILALAFSVASLGSTSRVRVSPVGVFTKTCTSPSVRPPPWGERGQRNWKPQIRRLRTEHAARLRLSPIVLNLKNFSGGVPVVAQQKRIQLESMRMWVQSLASLSGLRIHH